MAAAGSSSSSGSVVATIDIPPSTLVPTSSITQYCYGCQVTWDGRKCRAKISCLHGKWWCNNCAKTCISTVMFNMMNGEKICNASECFNLLVKSQLDKEETFTDKQFACQAPGKKVKWVTFKILAKSRGSTLGLKKKKSATGITSASKIQHKRHQRQAQNS